MSAPIAAPEAYWSLLTVVLFIVTASKALPTALADPFTSPFTLSTCMLLLVQIEFRLIWPLMISLSLDPSAKACVIGIGAAVPAIRILARRVIAILLFQSGCGAGGVSR